MSADSFSIEKNKEDVTLRYLDPYVQIVECRAMSACLLLFAASLLSERLEQAS